jgi:hypothetical protein
MHGEIVRIIYILLTIILQYATSARQYTRSPPAGSVPRFKRLASALMKWPVKSLMKCGRQPVDLVPAGCNWQTQEEERDGMRGMKERRITIWEARR